MEEKVCSCDLSICTLACALARHALRAANSGRAGSRAHIACRRCEGGRVYGARRRFPRAGVPVSVCAHHWSAFGGTCISSSICGCDAQANPSRVHCSLISPRGWRDPCMHDARLLCSHARVMSAPLAAASSSSRWSTAHPSCPSSRLAIRSLASAQ